MMCEMKTFCAKTVIDGVWDKKFTPVKKKTFIRTVEDEKFSYVEHILFKVIDRELFRHLN